MFVNYILFKTPDNRTVIRQRVQSTEKNGFFTYSLQLPPFPESGLWTAKATFGGKVWSLSLSLIPRHLSPLSISLNFSLRRSRSLSLSLSLSLAPIIISLTLLLYPRPHSLPLPPSLPPPHRFSLSHTHTLSPSLSIFLSLSPTLLPLHMQNKVSTCYGQVFLIHTVVHQLYRKRTI